MLRYGNRLTTGPTPDAVNPKRVVYSDELRGLAVVPLIPMRKKDPAKIGPEQLRPVLDGTGRKVRSREQFDTYRAEQKRIQKTGVVENILESPLMIVAAPVLFVASVLVAAHLVIGSPYYVMGSRRIEKYAYAGYHDGRAALDAKDPALAIKIFGEAEATSAALVQCSDLCFQEGRAYELMGDTKQARLEYQRFLDYSVRLYPDYFTTRDSKLVNDFGTLKSEFEEAEKKLATL